MSNLTRVRAHSRRITSPVLGKDLPKGRLPNVLKAFVRDTAVVRKTDGSFRITEDVGGDIFKSDDLTKREVIEEIGKEEFDSLQFEPAGLGSWGYTNKPKRNQ